MTTDPQWHLAADAGAFVDDEPYNPDEDPNACKWCSGTGVYSDEVMSRECPWCFGDGVARE